MHRSGHDEPGGEGRAGRSGNPAGGVWQQAGLGEFPGVTAITDEVLSAVARWRKEFDLCGVLPNDMERFSEINDYLVR
jgi:hypothetical protein